MQEKPMKHEFTEMKRLKKYQKFEMKNKNTQA